MKEEKNTTNELSEKELLKFKGREGIFIKLILTALVIVIISEFIGTNTFDVGIGSIVLLPMLYAVIIGILITPDVLGKKIKGLGKIIGKEEIELASPLVMLALLPLGVKYGTLVGPNIVEVVRAGPAFLLQELGNL